MYSFDIFDTLITRVTATPKGIFALIQDELLQNDTYKLISEYIRNNFYLLRVHSERLARKTYCRRGIQEISLEQIYEAMNTTVCLSTKEIMQLIELEKQMEYDCVVGIPENIEKLKKLLNHGEHVVLISDMYLDHQTLQRMLVKVDPVFAQVTLYVSSEYQKNKGNGTLYSLVRTMEAADIRDWIHIGDNVHADVQMARQCGITAQQYHYPSLELYEKELIQKSVNNSYVQLAVGTARNSRVLYKLQSRVKIGCSIGGGILFPYVWWILQQSMRKGIEKLYFIARDGFILKKIADLIIKEYGYPLRTSYIYGSRQVWRIASLDQDTDISQLLFTSNVYRIQSIRDLAEVFQISSGELYPFLPSCVVSEWEQLPYNYIRCYRQVLGRSKKFLDFLCEKHQEKKMQAIAYLRQEIDFEDGKFAFVELVGTGYTQQCLSKIMQNIDSRPIYSFFYKLDDCIKDKHCIFYNFFPTDLYLGRILEVLTRAPHGQTTGYEEQDGKIVPVLGEVEREAIIQHGYVDYLEGVVLYTRKFCHRMILHSPKGDGWEMFISYLDYLGRRPDKELLEFIGDMPNGETGRNHCIERFAPVLTKRQIRCIFWTGNLLKYPIETYYHGTELQYSLLRCNGIDKKLVEFYTRHQRGCIRKLMAGVRDRKEQCILKKYKYLFLQDLFTGRIVLYGAGNVGQALYEQIKRSSNTQLILWVDRAYVKYQQRGLEVTEIKSIQSVEYDWVVIAVMDKSAADAIEEGLLALDVLPEKIVRFNI